MASSLNRSLSLLLLVVLGSGCATTREGVGATIAGLGIATLAVATDDNTSGAVANALPDEGSRVALVAGSAAAILVGSLIALAPSRRPRPAPATLPAAPPAPVTVTAADVTPAPDTTATSDPGTCPPGATCLPMTP